MLDTSKFQLNDTSMHQKNTRELLRFMSPRPEKPILEGKQKGINQIVKKLIALCARSSPEKDGNIIAAAFNQISKLMVFIIF